MQYQTATSAVHINDWNNHSLGIDYPEFHGCTIIYTRVQYIGV